MSPGLRWYYFIAMLLLAACVKGTSLSPLSQHRLLGAERATAAVVNRQDGGMPSADRVLAESAFCAVDGVLSEGKSPRLDAGIACK